MSTFNKKKFKKSPAQHFYKKDSDIFLNSSELLTDHKVANLPIELKAI